MTRLLAIPNWLINKAEFLLGFMAVFFMSQISAFVAVGTLVFIDLFTGLWYAKKFRQRITSKRLKETGAKLVLYNVLLITCMIIEYYAVPEIPFIRVGLGIIATVEAVSIFENIEKVLGIKIVSRFKAVFQKNNPINVLEDKDKKGKKKDKN